MKLGIFGGSFNPPHKMHENIALELINKQCVDKIVFVPTGSKYKYKNNLLPDKNRLDMLEIIASKNDSFKVSDYELKDEVVYTYQTLKYFKELYPDDVIYFICGADNLSYVDKWMNYEEILNNYYILVVKRDGEDILELLNKFSKYRNKIVVADVDPKILSSTEIREKIKNGIDVSDVLDEGVYEYIKNNELYLE